MADRAQAEVEAHDKASVKSYADWHDEVSDEAHEFGARLKGVIHVLLVVFQS